MEKTAMNIFNMGVIGGVLGFLVSLLGGWDSAIETLLICMGLDYVSGLVCALVFKNSNKSETGAWSSYASFKGLCKKGAMLLLVVLAVRLGQLAGLDWVRLSVIIALVVNESLSIVENVGAMGVPIPKTIQDAIDVLKGRELQ